MQTHTFGSILKPSTYAPLLWEVSITNAGPNFEFRNLTCRVCKNKKDSSQQLSAKFLLIQHNKLKKLYRSYALVGIARQG
jgi:hypothetical protein